MSGAFDDEGMRMPDKMFPLQASRTDPPGPLQIPWSVAEIAYGAYVARCGKSQSLERLAERGGFGWNEMDMFHPNWRKEVSDIEALKKQIASIVKDFGVSLEEMRQEHNKDINKYNDEIEKLTSEIERLKAAVVNEAVR